MCSWQRREPTRRIYATNGMKMSIKGAQLRDVVSLHVGEAAGKSMWVGEAKWWPENQSRVSRLMFVVEEGEGSEEWAYWVHSLDAIKAGANSGRWIALRIGETDYYLGGAPGGAGKKATMMNGDIFFDVGEGPTTLAVRAGMLVQAVCQMPARSACYMDVNWIGVVTKDVGLPGIAGTSFYMRSIKGAKKTNVGATVTATSRPSGRGWGQLARDIRGHKRGEWWDWGGIGFNKGDTGLRLSCNNWMGPSRIISAINFPQFTRTVKLRIIKAIN